MEHLDSEDRITTSIISFLTQIGINVSAVEIDEETFLQGIMIDHGALRVDNEKLDHPGDLLHEAGHLAVMPPSRRASAHIDVGRDAGEEMMAIAWSYAALIHLELDPRVVFHDGGYRGGSQALIENFSHGRYIGVPTLQWLGMTAEAKQAKAQGVPPYPHMLKWLRDD
jgi:hypothetical protein